MSIGFGTSVVEHDLQVCVHAARLGSTSRHFDAVIHKIVQYNSPLGITRDAKCATAVNKGLLVLDVWYRLFTACRPILVLRLCSGASVICSLLNSHT